MEIYKKYIEGKSYRELHEIRHQSVPGSDVYIQVTEEIHRIQQDTNNTQVAKLIGEIKTLKDITAENAATEKREAGRTRCLAWLAIIISVIGILTQVAFSIERKDSCADFGGGDIRCTTWFTAGIFGEYVIPERSISK